MLLSPQALSLELLENSVVDATNHRLGIIEAAEEMFRKDVETNKTLAKFGAEFILNSVPAETEKVCQFHEIMLMNYHEIVLHAPG